MIDASELGYHIDHWNIEDGLPTQARLSALKRQHLEHVVLIACRDTPFLVVILDLDLASRPGASAWRGVGHVFTRV